MAKFLTELDTREVTDKVRMLLAPLIYESDLVGRIVVPERFFTDFASVPRIPIVFMLWGDRAHREAVIHDYLYRIDSSPAVSCSMANKVFNEVMVCRGKERKVRLPMYWGVVLGGWTAHHKRTVADRLV